MEASNPEMEALRQQASDTAMQEAVRQYLANHVDAYPATLELLGIVISAGLAAGSMGEDESDVLAAIGAQARDYLAAQDPPSVGLLAPSP